MDAPTQRPPSQERLVQDNLDGMRDLACRALEGALLALQTQDAEQAERVVSGDTELNHLCRIVEQECLALLEQRRPAGDALREVIASLQIAGELERIGDHAKAIARIVLEMDPADFSGPMEAIARMGDLVGTMLEQAMEAVRNRDASLACLVQAEDQEVDALDEEAVAGLMMRLMTAPDATMHSTHLLWIAYHLERIGDRVKNVAERALFMAAAEPAG